MAVSFNPYASQVQTASANPFQQRGEDQNRIRNDEPRDPAQTRPSGTAAAETQKSDTGSRQQNSLVASNDDRQAGQSQGSRRGGLIDVTV